MEVLLRGFLSLFATTHISSHISGSRLHSGVQLPDRAGLRQWHGPLSPVAGLCGRHFGEDCHVRHARKYKHFTFDTTWYGDSIEGGGYPPFWNHNVSKNFPLESTSLFYAHYGFKTECNSPLPKKWQSGGGTSPGIPNENVKVNPHYVLVGSDASPLSIF